MSFKAWRKWTRSKPFYLQWFIWLVLLRPIIDSLYFLKEISPLVSPPYIVGLLTPVMAIYAIIRTNKPRSSRIDMNFRVWAAFVFVGCAFIYFFDPLSLLTVEFLLKLSMPIYLFFFLRRFISSRKDLNGLLQTMLYAGIFVAIILIYEVLINPIRVVESRGLARIQGNFGDVVSYGNYIVFCALIAGYFLLSATRPEMRKRTITFIVVAGVGLLGLFNIHHIASYITFAGVFALFFIYNMRSNHDSGLIFVVIGAVAVFYLVGDTAQDAVQERVSPLLEQDLKVYQGELEEERLFHGRVGRWKKMWNIFSEQTVFAQFFGYPLQMKYAYHFVGIGSHNDYIRLLFFTGYFGLLVYLLLLVEVFKKGMRMTNALRFLVIGALVVLGLYSVSITPTFYAPFMYLIMSIFAFTALPITAVPHVPKEGPSPR